MNSCLRLLSCILLVGLSACQGSHFNALKGHALEQCRQTCLHHFEFCRQHCVDNCPTCLAVSKKVTSDNFDQYVHERNVEGKKVMRELNSYRDPLQCRKVTCDCPSDHVVCTKSCSGIMPKIGQTVPNCL